MNLTEFYPTPKKLIDKMLEGIKMSRITNILEPSAGKGDIADTIKDIVENSYNKGLDIDTIEIEPNLRHILKGKEYKVVHDDFLTFTTFKRYDLIIMNPPFSDGDKHLLKALEMQQHGGKIICILNAETLKKLTTNRRKDLARKLKEYDAEIKYMKGAFASAERKTNVDIAIVKCTIPDVNKASDIVTKLKKEESYKIHTLNEKQVAQGGFVQNIVEQYTFEVKAGIKLIE